MAEAGDISKGNPTMQRDTSAGRRRRNATFAEQSRNTPEVQDQPQVGMSELIKLLNELKSDLNNKSDELKSELNNKLDENKSELHELKSDLNNKLDENNKKSDEKLNDLNNKLDENKSELHELKSDLNNKLDENNKKLKLELNNKFKEQNKKSDEQNKNVNENIKKLNEELRLELNENNRKLNEKLSEHNNRLEEGLKEINEKVEQFENRFFDVNNQIQDLRLETQQEIQSVSGRITTDIDNRIIEVREVINVEVNKLSETTSRLNIIEKDINNIKDKPIIIQGVSADFNRDIPLFRNHQRNPIEFIHRLNEHLDKVKENNWTKIKYILDTSFGNINDSWWNANRNEIKEYNQFISAFKQKYWSESIQHAVRNEIEHGRYDATRVMTPTAYFLNRVCIARYLEPAIPEECLCAKLSYHYDEYIRRARLCSQIKTIPEMEALLADYENENYYRRRRVDRENAQESQVTRTYHIADRTQEQNTNNNNRQDRRWEGPRRPYNGRRWQNNRQYRNPYDRENRRRNSESEQVSNRNVDRENVSSNNTNNPNVVNLN